MLAIFCERGTIPATSRGRPQKIGHVELWQGDELMIEGFRRNVDELKQWAVAGARSSRFSEGARPIKIQNAAIPG
jgi:hypothetical protein